MTEMKIPLIKGDRLDGGVDYRDALPVNTLSVVKAIFDVEGYMTTHPGLGSFSDAPGRDRGATYNERQKVHYRVSDNSLIAVDFIGDFSAFELPKGEIVVLGAISGESSARWSQAVMPYSFNTQAIVTDEKMWLYDGTTLTQITDPDLGKPIDCVWINGYYFLTDGEYLFHTDIANEYAVEPDDFATSEFSPDPTLGLVKTQDNQVMVLNRYTTEFFYNDPSIASGFAFLRIQAKAVKAGIVGTHLKCELGGNVFCVGSSKEESPTVLVIGPGQSANVSTREVDRILAEYTEEELAEGGTMETRVQDRDQLVYLRLPRHTLCYNHSAALKFGKPYAWSIVKSGVTTDAPWVGVNGVYDVVGGHWIYGDRAQGRLGDLNATSNQQYGEDMEVIFYTPFVMLERASINELEVQTIPGATFDESLTVFLSMTYDGHSWGKEWSVEYGGFAQYDQRFIANRLGYVRHWFAFKLRAVTPYRLSFTRLVIDYG